MLQVLNSKIRGGLEILSLFEALVLFANWKKLIRTKMVDTRCFLLECNPHNTLENNRKMTGLKIYSGYVWLLYIPNGHVQAD